MIKTQIIKDRIIKFLGGYTEKEYSRVERKYQGLLDSKSDMQTVKVVNEYLLRMLRSLHFYSKSLYGLQSNEWANKMYNVIRNNYIRMIIRYVNSQASVIYTFDTTLENDKQFEDIITKEKSYSGDIESIIESIVETD